MSDISKIIPLTYCIFVTCSAQVSNLVTNANNQIRQIEQEALDQFYRNLRNQYSYQKYFSNLNGINQYKNIPYPYCIKSQTNNIDSYADYVANLYQQYYSPFFPPLQQTFNKRITYPEILQHGLPEDYSLYVSNPITSFSNFPIYSYNPYYPIQNTKQYFQENGLNTNLKPEIVLISPNSIPNETSKPIHKKHHHHRRKHHHNKLSNKIHPINNIKKSEIPISTNGSITINKGNISNCQINNNSQPVITDAEQNRVNNSNLGDEQNSLIMKVKNQKITCNLNEDEDFQIDIRFGTDNDRDMNGLSDSKLEDNSYNDSGSHNEEDNDDVSSDDNSDVSDGEITSDESDDINDSDEEDNTSVTTDNKYNNTANTSR